MQIIESGYTLANKPKLKVREKRDCYFFKYKMPCKVVWHCWIEDFHGEDRFYFHDSEVLYNRKLRHQIILIWMGLAFFFILLQQTTSLFQFIDQNLFILSILFLLFFMLWLGWVLARSQQDNSCAFSVPWQSITGAGIGQLRSVVCDDVYINNVPYNKGRQYSIFINIENDRVNVFCLTVSKSQKSQAENIFAHFNKAFIDPIDRNNVYKVPYDTYLETYTRMYDDRIIYRSLADRLMEGANIYSGYPYTFLMNPFFKSLPYVLTVFFSLFIPLTEPAIILTRSIEFTTGEDLERQKEKIKEYKDNDYLKREKAASLKAAEVRSEAIKRANDAMKARADRENEVALAKKDFQISFDKWVKHHLRFISDKDDLKASYLMEAEESIMVEQADLFGSNKYKMIPFDFSLLMKQEGKILNGIPQESFWEWLRDKLVYVASHQKGQGVKDSLQRVKNFLKYFSEMHEMQKQSVLLGAQLVAFASRVNKLRKDNKFIDNSLKRKKKVLSSAVKRVIIMNLSDFSHKVNDEGVRHYYHRNVYGTLHEKDRKYFNSIIDRILKGSLPISVLGEEYIKTINTSWWDGTLYISHSLLNHFILRKNGYKAEKDKGEWLVEKDYFALNREYPIYFDLKKGWCNTSIYNGKALAYIFVKNKRIRSRSKSEGYIFKSTAFNQAVAARVGRIFNKEDSHSWFGCRVRSRGRVDNVLEKGQWHVLDGEWNISKAHKRMKKRLERIRMKEAAQPY